MPRWKPNPAERLVEAALDLFAERGYENTTVIDIAGRAGLGKTTFFRHFPDKREVLFGGGIVDELLAEAITSASSAATDLEAVAQALDAVGQEVFTSARREFVARRQAVILANPELQEREALKNDRLITTISEALKRRGASDVSARVAAQLGSVTSAIAFERWIQGSVEDDYGRKAREVLAEVQSAMPLISKAETQAPD
ncbi:TetR/AcrR family transcriptional regulator [Brevibacterium sp. UCMA 11754]|uniref:TetR/AcrR family transcriptional regulator n=1 Tax=Brevibacterium sp. UCMA 11754 TaxID=2749198 RepID=UPI001F226438|nr:TetR/AcrR family transcriptional regulator [Brevibacterium sp. UCMA 11754]MCF2571363.1 TetR family transcriptional regulator [Brevibacterium sp. UCMA 11754]